MERADNVIRHNNLTWQENKMMTTKSKSHLIFIKVKGALSQR